jgi:hypothetical protein
MALRVGPEDHVHVYSDNMVVCRLVQVILSGLQWVAWKPTLSSVAVSIQAHAAKGLEVCISQVFSHMESKLNRGRPEA